MLCNINKVKNQYPWIFPTGSSKNTSTIKMLSIIFTVQVHSKNRYTNIIKNYDNNLAGASVENIPHKVTKDLSSL